MKILIATDGSEYGMSAVEFAPRFVSRDSQTLVKLVTVIEPAAGQQLTDPKNPAAQKAAEILRVSEERFLELCRERNVAASTEVLAGPAARAIVEEAEAWKADVIVVGSHGYGFWKRAWLGSVADRVMNHAHCSVLVVRHQRSPS